MKYIKNIYPFIEQKSNFYHNPFNAKLDSVETLDQAMNRIIRRKYFAFNHNIIFPPINLHTLIHLKDV